MSETHQTIRAIYRIESAKLIAHSHAPAARRRTGGGVGARRARDRARAVARERGAGQSGRVAHGRGASIARSISCAATSCSSANTPSSARALQTEAAPDLEARLDDDVGDDLLRLVFIACHPVLSTEARVALTLRLLGGLTTDEIARAFLVAEPTIAQRIVRAKRTLARRACAVRVAAARRARGAFGVGAGGDLPDLQRRLRRDRGR